MPFAIHRQITSMRALPLVLSAVLSIAALGAPPVADASVLYVCVSTKRATLRVIAKATKCSKRESKLPLNTLGLIGLHGAAGVQGPTGEGPQGIWGEAGPRAEAG